MYQTFDCLMVHPTGVEPAHPPPEGGALSTELRMHICLKLFTLVFYHYYKNMSTVAAKKQRANVFLVGLRQVFFSV